MSSHTLSRPRLLARAVWPLPAAACLGLLLTAAGCRDTREDTSYCKTCTTESTGVIDAGATGSQESAQSMPVSSTADSNISQASGTGVNTGSAPTSSQQAGTAGQAKGNSGTSASGTPAAGSSGNTRDAGMSSGGRSAANGSSGSSAAADQAGRGAAANGGSAAPRDAGTSQEPARRDAGHMEPLPCNGACPPDRPVCDESKSPGQCVQCTGDDNHACVGDTKVCDASTRKCVQCTAEDLSGCEGEMRACNGSNRCVRCSADNPTSCPPTQQVCDNETRCVECMPGRVDTCPIGRELCSSDGQCIQCTDNSRCTDAALAHCDKQTNLCVGCESDNDCSDRFPATPHCDKASRRCVVCTPDGPPTCGPGMFCDGNTHTCAAGSPTRMNCASCNAPQDCAASPEIAACVGPKNESYCFQAAIGGACQTGYTAQSVPEHQSTLYCLPPADSSCPAINSALMGKPCTMNNMNEMCGKNGLCIMPENICSVPCKGPQDCPPSMKCDNNRSACIKM